MYSNAWPDQHYHLFDFKFNLVMIFYTPVNSVASCNQIQCKDMKTFLRGWAHVFLAMTLSLMPYHTPCNLTTNTYKRPPHYLSAFRYNPILDL